MSANKQAMAQVGSPHVFSHSDFNRGNRLVKEVKDDNGVTIKKEIYLGNLLKFLCQLLLKILTKNSFSGL